MRKHPAIISILLLLALTTATASGAEPDKKMVILAFDGMDPRIVRELFDDGKLPNLRKLAEDGGFRYLWSSIPPQSPVAWSNFITGKNPGGHGIYDFIHRDPETYQPYLSVSETVPPDESLTLSLGKYRFPLDGGEVRNLRGGKAFWEYLEEAGVPCVIFKIPSNFPPAGKKTKSVSGMGTPDLFGSYGIYQYFTTDPLDIPDDYGGGRIRLVFPEGDKVSDVIEGPPNTFLADSPVMEIPLTAWIDPENPVARIDLGDQQIILNQGEWSDWVILKFDPLPLLGSTSGICRLFLKEARPEFKLYVSPININPLDPALPIDLPAGYAREVAEEAGLFYTQGMPEDTKALDNGTLTTAEFAQQAWLVLEERNRLFDVLFPKFEKGLFFFYYSSTDLGTHMFWHLRDPQHPVYDAEAREQLGDRVALVYEEMDKVVGKVRARFGEDAALIVMSDHGFGPLYRNFHLNTWLEQEGYLAGNGRGGIDFGRSRVYALGLNGLYINRIGREGRGIVDEDEAQGLMKELQEKLEAVTDPETGESVIKRVHRSDLAYSGEYIANAPDMMVGYDWGYRTAYQSALGQLTDEIVSISLEKWSGDHCGATDLVPGVLFSNLPLRKEDPRLYDITPAVLEYFGVAVPGDMNGSSIFKPKPIGVKPKALPYI